MKGDLLNRQGLSVSGALLLALDEVCTNTKEVSLKQFKQSHKFHVDLELNLIKYINVYVLKVY